jgi:glycosyltransferase involved in cell wall biosynthesis
MALCHEWLGHWTGSEKTFAAMAAAFPDADLYALTVERTRGFSFNGRTVQTTFLDRVPGLRDRRAMQLPLMPLAWRYASRRRYDVVVTSSHACVKGFRPARRALHLSYCYTPMRYAWLPGLDRRARRDRVQHLGAAYFRHWDRSSAGWVDEFAAISGCVRDRIEHAYGRTAHVIHPPVDVEYYCPATADRLAPAGGFALAAGRMVAYKRFDVAIRACHRVGVPLVVAGAGPEEGRLRALAAALGASVRFVVQPADDALRNLYRQAAVLVFPGEEDFGIIPVEAQACGTPVVAYGTGGVLDTVIPGVTGVLVEEDDDAEFAVGVQAALDHQWDPEACRANAGRFGAERFLEELRDWVAVAAAARGLDIT